MGSKPIYAARWKTQHRFAEAVAGLIEACLRGVLNGGNPALGVPTAELILAELITDVMSLPSSDQEPIPKRLLSLYDYRTGQWSSVDDIILRLIRHYMPHLPRMSITLGIYRDDEAENPSGTDQHAWSVYSFDKRHSNFKDPDSFETNVEAPEAGTESTADSDNSLAAKFRKGLAFMLNYLGHSGEYWSIASPTVPHSLDFARVHCAGIAVWENPEDWFRSKTVEERRDDLNALLSDFNAWWNGQACLVTVRSEDESIDDNYGSLFSMDQVMEYLSESRKVLAAPDVCLEFDDRFSSGEFEKRVRAMIQTVQAEAAQAVEGGTNGRGT